MNPVNKKGGYCMIKKIIVVITTLLILGLVGCSNENNDSITIDQKYTKVTIVELDAKDLLSFEYRIINHSKENVGPFYIKYIFHHKILHEYFGVKEYPSYNSTEPTEVTLIPNETFQGGNNIETLEEHVDISSLQDAITNTQAIEIQLIDIETENIIASQWINKFKHVDET